MYSLIEAFKMKCMQLQHAIRHGDDELVMALDREIEPLILRIVNQRASSASDMRLQLQLICDLIRDNSADKAAVLRNTAMLTVLINRYLLPSNGKSLLELAPDRAFKPDMSGQGADEATFPEAVLDSLDDSILAVTRDHHVLYANRTAGLLHDRKPLDMVGHHIGLFVGVARHSGEIGPAIDRCFADPDLALEQRGQGLLTVLHGVRSFGPSADTAVQAVLVMERLI